MSDAVAVLFENRQLTYRDLNERANQLASYLQSLGVGPEIRVCLCLNRPLELVVGLLGVLKAGGAYVPIDPRNPTQHTAILLADSGPKIYTDTGTVHRVFANGSDPDNLFGSGLGNDRA